MKIGDSVMKKAVLAFYALFVAAGLCCAQNGAGCYAGYWNGVLSVGGQSIKMEFEILELQEGVVGKMNAQGVKGIPVEVSAGENGLELQVKQLGMKYSGVKMGNGIMGTFEQHGITAPLILYPGKLEVNRPQTPKAPYPYKTEEVSFANAAEGATLTGTITYPVGYETMKAKNVPVVVMVTGSGTQNRDEEIFDHKPFAVIADWLARNGIASLRYDDRGAGGSSKPVEGATSENNAGDAKAAVAFVKGLKRFGKVGVLGHSEGGTIALMLAGERLPDFIISLAGVATQGVDCIVWQNVVTLEGSGVPQQMAQDYGKALRGIYAERIKRFRESVSSSEASVRLQGGAIPQAKEFIGKLCVDEGLKLPPQFVANLEAVASSKSLWLDWFVWYNPAETVGKIKCPVMALNGSYDMQVPAEANLGVLRELLPANGKHLVKEYPQLNHLLQKCTRETSLKYGDIEETISQEVLEDIVQWIGSL